MTPEFSHPVKLDQIGGQPQSFTLSASQEERAALTKRFGLISVATLDATLSVTRDGEAVSASGQFAAELEQACIASGEPVPVSISEPVEIRFVPTSKESSEVELDSEDCDVIEYEGLAVDLGEAIAQSLALALDPYPRGPNATTVLRAAGVKSESEAQTQGPLAALLRQPRPS